MLMALCDQKEGAAKVAEAYIDMAIPITKASEISRETEHAEMLKQIEDMGPQHFKVVT